MQTTVTTITQSKEDEQISSLLPLILDVGTSMNSHMNHETEEQLLRIKSDTNDAINEKCDRQSVASLSSSENLFIDTKESVHPTAYPIITDDSLGLIESCVAMESIIPPGNDAHIVSSETRDRLLNSKIQPFVKEWLQENSASSPSSSAKRYHSSRLRKRFVKRQNVRPSNLSPNLQTLSPLVQPGDFTLNNSCTGTIISQALHTNDYSLIPNKTFKMDNENKNKNNNFITKSTHSETSSIITTRSKNETCQYGYRLHFNNKFFSILKSHGPLIFFCIGLFPAFIFLMFPIGLIAFILCIACLPIMFIAATIMGIKRCLQRCETWLHLKQTDTSGNALSVLQINDSILSKKGVSENNMLEDFKPEETSKPITMCSGNVVLSESKLFENQRLRSLSISSMTVEENINHYEIVEPYNLKYFTVQSCVSSLCNVDPVTALIGLVLTPFLCFLSVPILLIIPAILICILPLLISLPIILLLTLPLMMVFIFFAALPILFYLPWKEFNEKLQDCITYISGAVEMIFSS